MVFDLTTKSLRILLNAVPIWIRPLAYGGPSCSTYNGRPARDARILWYSFSSSHRASILGSACGRLAFMEKAVVGRLTVCFSTTFCGSILGITLMVPSSGSRAVWHAVRRLGLCDAKPRRHVDFWGGSKYLIHWVAWIAGD